MKLPVFLKYGCIGSILLFALSCQKDPDDNRENEYLVDYSPVSSYSQIVISAILSGQTIEYPEMADIVEHADYGVQVYRISYKTHYLDSIITASGLVCLPMADKAFPVISFQNGTNTADDNAPSVNPNSSLYMMMEFMASNGYIVLMTDYIGFGSSSGLLHPYYHRTSNNHAVIDMILAINEFTENKDILAQCNESVYLMGYSQGGWATLSTLMEIEQGNEHPIQVNAASCGAGAYFLTSFTNSVLDLTTFPGPLYFPYFIYSEKVIGEIQEPLDIYFKEPYASRIPELFNGSYENDEVNAQLNDTVNKLLTDDLINAFFPGTDFNALSNALVNNSLSAWTTEIPIRFYHGTEDLNVPPDQSQLMVDDFQDIIHDEQLVQYFDLEGKTHETGLIPWGIQTIKWFNLLEDK